jgi:hypothetical protein
MQTGPSRAHKILINYGLEGLKRGTTLYTGTSSDSKCIWNYKFGKVKE